ncbi:MAG: ATP-binding cassette domain-containing protein [Gammaproteobacteria bacterium]|nr:ATP-binding cassette domain-containing protein [Gammaproteobacteria bacterium]
MLIEGATRRFGSGSSTVLALDGAWLGINTGEFVALAGPSGSGKSTLLNLIGAMDRPNAGRVVVGGVDLSAATDRELTDYRRHQVGFVFQFYNLISTLTALENVQIVAQLRAARLRSGKELRPGKEGAARMAAQAALDGVGLGDRAGHFPAELSGGEQQRVAIARAIVGRPPLLLCDEPTGALDAVSGALAMALIDTLRLRYGTTVIVITHDGEVAARADRIVDIRDGRLQHR